MSNFILWAIFLGCEQLFCRRQKQDNHASQLSFEPARHGKEMVSPLAGAFIPSYTIYQVLPDLPGSTITQSRIVLFCFLLLIADVFVSIEFLTIFLRFFLRNHPNTLFYV